MKFEQVLVAVFGVDAERQSTEQGTRVDSDEVGDA